MDSQGTWDDILGQCSYSEKLLLERTQAELCVRKALPSPILTPTIILLWWLSRESWHLPWEVCCSGCTRGVDEPLEKTFCLSGVGVTVWFEITARNTGNDKL